MTTALPTDKETKTFNFKKANFIESLFKNHEIGKNSLENLQFEICTELIPTKDETWV